MKIFRRTKKVPSERSNWIGNPVSIMLLYIFSTDFRLNLPPVCKPKKWLQASLGPSAPRSLLSKWDPARQSRLQGKLHVHMGYPDPLLHPLKRPWPTHNNIWAGDWIFTVWLDFLVLSYSVRRFSASAAMLKHVLMLRKLVRDPSRWQRQEGIRLWVLRCKMMPIIVP